MTAEYSNFMELKFSSRSENESFARVAVAAFLARLDPTVDELSDIKTVVSEAVTNAVIHGYADQPDGVICLSVKIEDRTVTIQVADSGVGIYDIEQVKEPLYTSKPELERSGMGFTIMENFMDELMIESSLKQGTTVTMVKTFAPYLQPAVARR